MLNSFHFYLTKILSGKLQLSSLFDYPCDFSHEYQQFIQSSQNTVTPSQVFVAGPRQVYRLVMAMCQDNWVMDQDIV